jgi:hypothetical protein
VRWLLSPVSKHAWSLKINFITNGCTERGIIVDQETIVVDPSGDVYARMFVSVHSSLLLDHVYVSPIFFSDVLP